MVKCEFNLCIYNDDNDCILKKIEINGAGYCESCILPDISEELLKTLKRETLNNLSDKKIFNYV